MLPIKQLLFTSAPDAPIQITLLAVVTLKPAPTPNAILPLPGALLPSALAPTAVLTLPTVLLASALAPTAVLEEAGPPFGAPTGPPGVV